MRWKLFLETESRFSSFLSSKRLDLPQSISPLLVKHCDDIIGDFHMKPSSPQLNPSLSRTSVHLSFMASSLLEQSIRSVLRELAAGSENLTDRFTEFEPEKQQLFLRHIGSEIAGLKSKEKELKLIKSLMATTDLQIHTVMSPEDPECPRDRTDLLWRRDIWSEWQYTSPAYRESFLMTHYLELKKTI